MENSELRACTETIYEFIYSPKGLKLNLPSFLRFKRKKRGVRYSRKSRKSNIPDLVSIHIRPEKINDRQEYGHWEGDLVIFSTICARNITTMVERKSRYVKVLLNENKTSNEVIDRINKTISTMPTAFKSITFDRGTEFTYHTKLPTKTYFCDPRSPWQKGAIENTNSRIMNLLPKRVRPLLLKQIHLDLLSNLMNNTPVSLSGLKHQLSCFTATYLSLRSPCCASS